MEILTGIVVGALAGGLVAAAYRSAHFSIPSCVGVGILGGLLGLACDFWLGREGLCNIAYSEFLASGIGASVTLFLWIVAQRLFLSNPSESLPSE